MNAHAFEMKRSDLQMAGSTCGDAWDYPPSFKPAGRLRMFVAWQTSSEFDCASTREPKSPFHAFCAVIFMAVLVVTAFLGTYYACELLAQRVQCMQLLRYSRPQASISDARKYANPR